MSGEILNLRPWLQQKDVDALFGAEKSAGEVRPFDFLAPPRLARERRLVLEGALERFSPALASLLSARFRKAFEVLPESLETVRAGDFVNALPVPCAAYPLPMADSMAVLDLGLPFTLALVDRAFGGNGDAPWFDRALTPLEQKVVLGVASQIPGLLRETFRLPATLGAVGAVEADPASLPLRSRDEVFVALRLVLRAPGLDTTWTLGLPLDALEPMFTPVEAVSAPAPVANLENARELQQAHVTIVARLPFFRVRAGDLAELHAGQTLSTGHAAGIPAEVLVNGQVRFRGTVGQMRGRLGLQITEALATPTPARPARDREGRAL